MVDKPVYFSKTYTTTQSIPPTETSNEIFISLVDQDEYAPFDTIIIDNLDSVVLGVNLDNNPDNRIVVQTNSVKIAENQRFRSFSITNLDDANAHTAGTIKIMVQKTTKPSWVR